MWNVLNPVFCTHDFKVLLLCKGIHRGRNVHYFQVIFSGFLVKCGKIKNLSHFFLSKRPVSGLVSCKVMGFSRAFGTFLDAADTECFVTSSKLRKDSVDRFRFSFYVSVLKCISDCKTALIKDSECLSFPSRPSSKSTSFLKQSLMTSATWQLVP